MRVHLVRTLRRASLLVALVLGACGGGGGGGGLGGGPPPPSGPGALAGTVAFTPSGAGGVLEAEPNDTVDQAHDLGPLLAGQTMVIQGHTTVDGSDPFDGFQLVAPERVRVTATLTFPDAGGNDFDLLVFEHVTFQFAEVFFATTSPEVGVFHVKGVFEIVVQAYAGSGDYVLTIVAEDPGTHVLEREPNEAFGESQYLGEAHVGDTITVKGTLEQGFDPFDVISLACPEDAQLYLSLTIHDPQADFDLSAWDGSADLTAPTLLQSFVSATNNPEIGIVSVVAGTFLEVSVDHWSGTSPWTLLIVVQPVAPLTQKPVARSTRAVAAMSKEGGRRRDAARDASFGEVRREIVPGEALVAFAGDAEGQGARSRVAERGFAPSAEGATGVTRFELVLPPDLDEQEARRTTLARVGALGALRGVRWSEPNGIRRACAEPDDTYYNLHWHYPMLRLPEAWDITTGSSSVIVAVLDTGRTDHPDLVGNQAGGFDFISSATNGGDFNGRDPDPTDVGDDPNGGSTFHGTHVAGTIGAVGGNRLGVTGVCWDVQIMHLRVLGRQGGTDADIAEAIRYAAGLPNVTGLVPPAPARIINMSLGGPGGSATMQAAITAARNAGTVVFAAAGNDASNGLTSPAGLDGVISVSAVDMRGVRSYYSNFGPLVDLACPGGDVTVDRNGDGYADGVLSTLMDDTSGPATPTYRFYQGTSMACPHAAGVAALMLSVAPGLTPAQIETFMTATATDLGVPGRDDLYGFGLVDALAAVRAAQGGPAPVAPRLGLARTALSFGSNEATAVVGLENLGGGTLSVGDPLAIAPYGGPWLSASLVGPANASSNATGIRIDVTRTGLDPGFYAGRVAVASTGGSRDIQVLMEVRDSDPPPLSVPIFVLLLDPLTRDTVAEATVNPAGTLDFAFADLTAGEYLLVAGSDLDGDGFICDAGEYCGEWPVSGSPQPLTVVGEATLSGVSLHVGYRPVLGAAAASTAGETVEPAGGDGPCARAAPGGFKRAACR